MVAAIAPRLAADRLSLLTRYALWSIALDDRIDHADVDPAELTDLLRSISAVTDGSPVGDGDPLLAELVTILDELSGFDRTGEWVSGFVAALRAAVVSGIDHAALGRAVAGDAAPVPSLDSYLAVAAPSLNYHSFAIALLILSGKAADLSRVEVALDHGARALRLANDLRSVARDRDEGTLNVLSLRTPAGDPVTSLWVQHEIGRHVLAHHAALQGDPMPASAALTRCLRISLDLYRSTDLR